MAAAFPFLTAYDPPGTSEGSLDPLGLYQIADQLAMQLVPAVRERMLRIRLASPRRPLTHLSLIIPIRCAKFPRTVIPRT